MKTVHWEESRSSPSHNRPTLLEITGFELGVSQMTGIMVMTGNKKGCWCRNGRRGVWRGRWETWPPFLPTVRSSHWEDIHKIAIQSSIPILPRPPPLQPDLLRGCESTGQGNFHPGNIVAADLGFGERLAISIESCARADTLPPCATPPYPPPHPPQPLNLLPVPQLAHKADNELFTAAIHLHTRPL